MASVKGVMSDIEKLNEAELNGRLIVVKTTRPRVEKRSEKLKNPSIGT